MTNETIAKLIDNGDDFERKWKLRRQRRVELSDEAQTHNKPVLFDVLHGLGVAKVEVYFDGYGDAGQIEDIAAFDAAGAKLKVNGLLTIKTVKDDLTEGHIEDKQCSIAEGIERVCYEYLTATHDGWENDDGSFGTFVFDVAAHTVKLDVSERYTETRDYEHKY